MSGDDDSFDGMFDLDGDGMTDLGEQFLPYMIFQDMMHDDEDDWFSDALDDDEDADAYIWISVCSIRLFWMRWRSSMPRRKRRNDSVAIPCPMCLKSRAGGSQKTNSSGPNVGDFVHPDDFYDWYRDDFVDFEEAEDYYYSHGGR